MSHLIVCHACDLVQRIEPFEGPTRIRCSRCSAEILRHRERGLEAALAVALSAFVLFILANAYPLATLTVNGVSVLTTLAGAALALLHHGYPTIALLVAFTTILVPLVQISGYLMVLGALLRARRRGRRASRSLLAPIRLLAPLRPWTMVEVFMLGALVALSKLSAMADAGVGIALGAYAMLMLALSALWSLTPAEQLWRWIDEESA